MRSSAALVIAAVLATACGKKAETPAPMPTAAPPMETTDATPSPPEADAGGVAPTPAPAACEATLEDVAGDKQELRVGGVAVAIPLPDTAAGVALFSLKQGESGRLVGVVAEIGVELAYDDDAVLWAVDCAHLEAAPVQRYVEAGADFGHAVASADGASIYYARKDGLGRLGVADMKAELLVPASPVDSYCARFRGEEGVTWLERFFPQQLSDAGLLVYVGAECGYEGDWELYPMIVTDIDDPAARRLVLAVSTSALVVGVGDVVWLGDAGHGDYPVKDVGTKDVVWRSDDAGISWTPVAVAAADPGAANDPAAEPRALGGTVRDIVADGTDAGHVAVLGSITDNGAGEFGGNAMVTRDGGKTWRPVADPFVSDFDEGQGIARLWSPDRDVDHLFAADGGNDGELRVVESKDGGKTWVEATAKPPKREVSPVTVGGVRLESGHLGLTRVAADGAREASFPPPNWRVRARGARAPVGWGDVAKAEKLNAKGVRLAGDGKLDEAVAAYQEVLAADPNHDITRYNLACAHARAGRTAEAMQELEALSAAGGYQALAALKAAPRDSDLDALQKSPAFRRITQVGPLGATFVGRDDDDAEQLDFTVASDPHERLCVWTLQPQGEAVGAKRVELIDCVTETRHGSRVASPGRLDELDAWLQGLGMVAWQPTRDEDLAARAVRWLKQNRRDLETADDDALRERITMFAAPAKADGTPGGHLALRVDGTPPLQLFVATTALPPKPAAP